MFFEKTKLRDREVRDVYRKLRQKYRAEVVMSFIRQNYFLGENTVYSILSRVDEEAVTNGSMLHAQVMDENFHI